MRGNHTQTNFYIASEKFAFEKNTSPLTSLADISKTSPFGVNAPDAKVD